MDETKANLIGGISVGILKNCIDSNISILTKILNTSLAEVTPVLKKEDELNKENYRRLVFFPTHLRYLKE